MKNRILGLVVALAATMLLLVIGPSAAFADPPVASDYTYPTDVVVGDIVVVEISDFATDPNPDHTVTLYQANYPCQYGDVPTQIKYEASFAGQDSCTVQVWDAVGQPSLPVTLTFNVVDPPPEDVEAPIVNITLPANGDTVSTDSVTLSYTVIDDQDPAPTCDRDNGSNVELNEGPNAITVTCTDATGNEGSATVNVTYVPPDNEAPVVTIYYPSNGQTVTESSVTLSFGVIDNLDPSPTCNRESVSDVELNEGPNAITVTCTDATGNEGSATVNVTYAPPPVEIYVGDATVTEVDPNQGTVSAVFPVTLSRPASMDITLHYGTFWIPFVSGQALPGSDYVMTVGSLVIPAGQTTGQISVTVKADNKKEANEIFFLLSFTCDQSVVQDDHVAVGTIVNDD